MNELGSRNDLSFLWKYVSNKVFWFFAKPIRTSYRLIVRPRIQSTKILVLNSDSVLLVRPNYGHRQWSVPGGAVERGESFEQAAKRELEEETNIVTAEISYLGEYERVSDYTTVVTRAFFTAVNDLSFSVDGIEIKEAKWFSMSDLPSNRAANVDRVVEMFRKRSLP